MVTEYGYMLVDLGTRGHVFIADENDKDVIVGWLHGLKCDFHVEVKGGAGWIIYLAD